jgi:hypothetical protein
MCRPTHLFAVIFLAALLINVTPSAFGAAAGKGRVNPRGGRAGERMSEKGAANTNAQWSADPDRGWVRADERHKLNEKPGSSKAGKNHDKQKGKEKGKKF